MDKSLTRLKWICYAGAILKFSGSTNRMGYEVSETGYITSVPALSVLSSEPVKARSCLIKDALSPAFIWMLNR